MDGATAVAKHNQTMLSSPLAKKMGSVKEGGKRLIKVKKPNLSYESFEYDEFSKSAFLTAKFHQW